MLISKSIVIGIIALMILFIETAYADIIINDGQIHDVNWIMPDNVRVEDGNQGFTTFNLLNEGLIQGSLRAYDKTHMRISGGTIEKVLEGCYDSTIMIESGIIGQGLFSWDYSRIDIYDCEIGMEIYATCASTVTLMGGTIGTDIFVWDDAQVIVSGRDFKVDDISVPYGAISVESGHLTGFLENGDWLNNDFFISGPRSAIILIPETSTVFLMCFGGLFILRQKIKLNRMK